MQFNFPWVSFVRALLLWPVVRSILLGVLVVLVACTFEALTLTRLQSSYLNSTDASKRTPILFSLVRERGTLVQFADKGYMSAEPGVSQREVLDRVRNRYPQEYDEKKVIWSLVDSDGAIFYRLTPNWRSIAFVTILASLIAYPYLRSRHLAAYAKVGRLADVLALLQVLGQAANASRSETGLEATLQGPPRSADAWVQVAAQHPEFFRVDATKDHPVTLLARFARAGEHPERAPIDAEHLSALMATAAQLHERDITQVNRWHVWVPVVASAIAAFFAGFVAK